MVARLYKVNGKENWLSADEATHNVVAHFFPTEELVTIWFKRLIIMIVQCWDQFKLPIFPIIIQPVFFVRMDGMFQFEPTPCGTFFSYHKNEYTTFFQHYILF